MTIQIESEHFKASELRCRHCGKGGVRTALLEVLEDLRARVGPVVINSAYRCPEHPVESAKLKPGMHASGLAADVRSATLNIRRLYDAIAADERIKGIGVDHGGGYIHIDVREAVSRVQWVYRGGRAVTVVDPWAPRV